MPGAPEAPRAGGPCWAPPHPAPRPCRLPASFPGLASSALAPGPGTLSGKALGTSRASACVCVCGVCSYHTLPPHVHLSQPPAPLPGACGPSECPANRASVSLLLWQPWGPAPAPLV